MSEHFADYDAAVEALETCREQRADLLDLIEVERDLRGGECVVSYDPVRGFRVVPREPGDGPLTRP